MRYHVNVDNVTILRYHVSALQDSHYYLLSEDKMPLAKDLLHPLAHEEKRKHKLKRLVQHPNSYFMDVKCPGCYR